MKTSVVSHRIPETPGASISFHGNRQKVVGIWLEDVARLAADALDSVSRKRGVSEANVRENVID
jgi:hypothetical protein